MLELRNIRKEYRTGQLTQKALDGVSLTLRRSEFVAILGPSGSGKTTLLNIVGGLDHADSGEMLIDGVPTSRYSDRDWDGYRNHRIGFVFQSYNLIPHQTLLRNVELALTLAGVSREERRTRALNALESVGLREQAHKKPSQLSGGQMQRVAIARALVNDPAIVLADEPTGALDSNTGEQVMQLLQEVAKDRLVVMVTHNGELAQKYATRIVRVKNGQIIEDSNPYDGAETAEEPEKPAVRKTRRPSMSFLTALSLSVSNLLSKKARTILVAFAASIGIVGIALILSLSNGANTYIHHMEEASLSEYPLEINSSAFSMESAMMSFAGMMQSSAASDGTKVNETQMLGGMFSGVGTNDLAAMKRWLDSGDSGMEELTRGIDYRYGLSPQIYLPTENGYRQVNPDPTMAAMGLTTSENLSGMMASYGMNDAFLPIPGNEALYKDSYELRAGHWPEKDTDCVLVLTSSGNVPDMLLYTMGLKDAEALNAMIGGVMAGSSVDTSLSASASYDPEEFLGISFRILPASNRYQYDDKLGVWVDCSGDAAAMKALLDEADELHIVGVVQPLSRTSVGILRIGIGYPAALGRRMMAEAAASPVVKAQLAAPETDVLTGLPFGQTPDSMDLFRDLFANVITVHPEHIGDAVSVDWESLPSLETDETQLTYTRAVRILREWRRTGKSPTLQGMLDHLWPLVMDLIHIDETKLDTVISVDMDESRIQEVFASRAVAASATLQGNLLKFGYADEAAPSAIIIYPKDFEAKNGVLNLLNAYNAVMKEEGHPEKVIQYTDYVGSLMSSVTTIIDVISYILIAFVAVSLVVSSIMIGIITYISVLERRKEIGILRALGASKRNITQVFNAETFIIGILSGAFGIGLTLLLQLPINAMIRSLTDEPVAAALPAGAGGILVLLCILMTFIGGLIPSRKAAKQDPVLALRSE